MPSVTIHVKDEDYVYAIDTQGEQATSGRFAELIHKGRKYENEVEE